MSPMPENCVRALAAARETRKLKPTAPRPSLRKANRAMCRDCIHDPLGAGSAARQVENCTSTECPLFQVRPRLKPSTPTEPSTRCERTQEGPISDTGSDANG
jgi:hypothetical protein